MAIDYGCTGPVLRGSGVDHDLRRDGEPIYTRMYEGYAFDMSRWPRSTARPRRKRCSATAGTGSTCGCWKSCSRSTWSARRSTATAPPQGTYREPIKLTTKLPKGEAYLETECPRGQMGFYIVSNGDADPLRARAKSSCFCNLSVTHELCRGCLIADVPAIVGSLDIVMGEIDR